MRFAGTPRVCHHLGEYGLHTYEPHHHIYCDGHHFREHGHRTEHGHHIYAHVATLMNMGRHINVYGHGHHIYWHAHPLQFMSTGTGQRIHE